MGSSVSDAEHQSLDIEAAIRTRGSQLRTMGCRVGVSVKKKTVGNFDNEQGNIGVISSQLIAAFINSDFNLVTAPYLLPAQLKVRQLTVGALVITSSNSPCNINAPSFASTRKLPVSTYSSTDSSNFLLGCIRSLALYWPEDRG